MFLKRLLQFVLITIALSIIPQSVNAQDGVISCILLNNQDFAAVGLEDVKEELEKKLIVITEEAIGPEINDFSKRCARNITCVQYKKRSPGDGGQNTNTPSEIKKTCYTEYAETCPATTSLTQDRINNLGTDYDLQGEPTVTCEFVTAYVANSGADLLYRFIGLIYQYMAILSGVIGTFTLVLGGVMITTAGSSTEQVNKARDLITRSLIGLTVLLLSALILYAINPNFFIIT